MAQNVNFDSILYRPIAKGEEFENLIPKPKGSKIPIGKGDTGFSIEMMVETVEDYSSEMEAVAEKLQTRSLTGSIENVKDFIYNHFQYKADSEDQLLRTPSHAWHLDRYTGIDCKSYSILASCLLTEMEILHYIRKIKQPTFEPDAWTHVYVVVPVNQESGDLQDGYYTVDGTLYDNCEPAFTESSDVFMSLQHYRLNAPATGLGLSIGNFNISNITSVKGLFNMISCIGGTTYNKTFVTKILNSMNKYINELVLEINQAAKDGDADTFAEAVAEYNIVVPLCLEASKKKLITFGGNACSDEGIRTVIKAWEFFNTNGKLALNAWLNENFVKDPLVQSQTLTFDTTQLWTVHGLGATQAGMTKTGIVEYYDPKPQTINAFELTPYVQTTTATNFNPLQFVEGLTTVLTSFDTGSTNPNNPTDTGTGTTNTAGNNSNTTAGGGALGLILALAGIGLVWGVTANQKDKPLKSKPTKTTAKK